MADTFQVGVPKLIMTQTGPRVGLKTDRDLVGVLPIDPRHKIAILALKGKATITVANQDPVQADGFGVHEFISDTTGTVDIRVKPNETFSFIMSPTHTGEPCQGSCTIAT
jgi:hypothetical protein